MNISFKHLVSVCALCGLLALAGCDLLMSTEAHVERARSEMSQGNFRAAAIDLRNALKKSSTNTEARLMLATLLLRLGDARSAQVEIERATRDGLDPARGAPLMAETRLWLGQAAELLKLIDEGGLSLDEPGRSTFRGRALSALGRHVEAAAAFEQALQAKPGDVSAQIGLAETLAVRGQSDAALKLLSGIPDTDPQATEAKTLQGRILLGRGQYSEAEAVLRHASDHLPPDIAVTKRAMLWTYLAEAQLAQGKVDAAERVQQQLSQEVPELLAGKLVRARVQLARGDYTAAITELQRVLVAAPDLIQARMMLGAAHLSQGNLQQAENQLAQVVDRAPDNIEARKLLARVRLQLDRPDAALRVLTPALEGEGSDPQLYSLAGAAQLRAGDSQAALATLGQNVRLHPTEEAPRLDLAAAYISAGRYTDALDLLKSTPEKPSARRAALIVVATAAQRGQPEARAELERLVADQPDNVELLHLAAMYFGSQREFERSRVYLARVLETAPEDTRALRGLASVEFMAGNSAGAEQALRRALKSEPKSSDLHLALSRLYLTQNDLARARAEMDAAVTASGGRAEVENAAGSLLLDSLRFDEALARFRRAASIDPSTALYWLNAGRAQLALNQPAAARESLEKALSLHPDWMPVQSLLVLVDLRASGPSTALKRAQELRNRQPGESGALVLEGDVRMVMKEYAAAAKAYEDAERIRPDAVLAVKNFEARRLGSLERPEAPLTRWLAVRPEDNRVRLVLSQYYVQTSRPQRAVAELETISRQDPRNPAALNNLAWLYYVQGDGRAEETARRAYELAPSNAAIADTYGWILLGKRQTARALELLEKAANGAPDNPEIGYHYGAALAAAGRRAEAHTALRKAVDTSQTFAQRAEAEELLTQLKN